LPKPSAAFASVPEDPDFERSDDEQELTPAIFHVDMDSFFASVEVLDDPSLAGKPVIVGGSGGRGVVASCTYEARAYGVHSAMPSVRARQLCPDAIFVDGHYSRYSEMSERFREALLNATPLVEPVGLDEAFLDVTGVRRVLGPAEPLARCLRQQIFDELQLECSIGVGRTKLIAKLASRRAKPIATRQGKQPGPGVLVIRASEELDFLHPLGVEAIWGVGPATTARLHDLGLRTVGDLARLPKDILVARLGRAHGLHLAALARAEDPSPVVPDRPVKSVGHEETFSADLYDLSELRGHLGRMAESVSIHLRSSGIVGRTITVKVKYRDFSLITRSHTMPSGIDTGAAVGAVGEALLDGIDISPGVRLLGLSISGLQPTATTQQLTFDLSKPDAPSETVPAPDQHLAAERDLRASELQSSWQDVTGAIDAIREKFGRSSVGTAAMVRESGIEVPRRREAPWGPSDKTDAG
jgi:DNA polymerase-4